MTGLDLVVLVPGKDDQQVVEGLLSRPESLGIRPIIHQTIVHPHRDPGCLKEAHQLLQPFLGRAGHALVMFDREGCGREEASPEALEERVEDDLKRNGWTSAVVRAIAIDPELENWIWATSPHVANALGWSDLNDLRQWLRNEGSWDEGAAKPREPKECVEAALRRKRIPRSSSIYRAIAESVSLTGCTDERFARFISTLSAWFPRDE